jgi:hypothetical protein
MLTGDRITPRPSEKARSRIEEFGAEIAKLSAEYNQLDGLSGRLARLAGREDEIGCMARANQTHLKDQLDGIENRRNALHDLVSWEKPTTMREAYLLMLLCGWRHANDGDEETDAVGRLLDAITMFLEEQSGTTAEDLGLGDFISRGRAGSSRDNAFALIERANAEPAAEGAS